MIEKRGYTVAFLFLLVFIVLTYLVSANTYLSDVYFTVSDTVFKENESAELKGYVYQANYTDNGTLVSSSAVLQNAMVNLTIKNSSTVISNYTFITTSAGAFFSASNHNRTAMNVSVPSQAGTYKIRVEHKDVNNNLSFSEVEIIVVNQTLDSLSVSSDKAVYNPSESMIIEVEAIRLVGDKEIFVANVSINGSLRNSTKSVIQSFACTTGNNGKCTSSVTAPSSYGDYFIELNGFKAFSSFSVVPFSYNAYMEDDLNGLKNIFAVGEKAKVEVKINNASSSDSYTFSGYIADSGGSSVKSIDSTTLNSANSFTNGFQFNVDAVTFGYGTYSAHITVSKSGDGSISSVVSFQVQDWALSVDKKSASSGFEYEFSAFPNKTLRFEALPTYRANGSVIQNITSISFNISLEDSLGNAFSSTNAAWNASCGKSGCYEFSVVSPLNAGKYILETILSHLGDTQTDTRVINVISGVMSAQSTDKDGSIKELFGTNEYVYLTVSAYNQTSSLFNLTDAEVFLVTYMNGTEYSYTQVNYSLVNSSNSVNEWGWNATQQKIKLDVPKAGGLYDVFVFGNNRTLGANAKFIVNPYDSCVVSKNSPSTSGSGSSFYYSSQFKTTDTVYFEIQLTQANNPSGRASASNGTGNSSSYGMYGGGCNANTATKQVISNATITVLNVKNLESGSAQTVNLTASTCQSTDTSGRYSCTVQPDSKWDGGMSIAKFYVVGPDGSSSVFYGNFEARAFYLYGWSSNWQNNPSNNISLNLWMYEVGGSSSFGGYQTGKGGTVTVKKVEYQGRDGEWVWPPVDSGYNVTNLSSVSVTSSNWNTNTLTLPVSLAPGGSWKTGYYRVALQGTTTSGDTDYGYAWFAVKLWDVYGQPIECTSTTCNYKSYFNSKENVTLYVIINKAGDNWWGSNTGGGNIYGNVSVAIKKIQDCRTWPCKELNSTEYTASRINVNSSSPAYWYASTNQSNYMIQINKTSGSWGTGYYSVVLDVNSTDTGYAWFNTIAFYVEAQPTNSSGTGSTYNIRGNQPVYFNVTTTKSYKWSYSGGARYNISDYINTTVSAGVLRTWDSQTYASKELNYPTNFNITPLNINGNGLINVTFNGSAWPTGYYWGELTLNNSEGESSTGWLWFNVQPFRVSTSSNSYNVDSEQCVNISLSVYDSDWSSNTPLSGNYSINKIYEDVWSGSSSTQTQYSNFTVNSGTNNTSFNATANVSVCPNNNLWSGGSWGGYHYLNIVVKDNVFNDSQSGWVSFRTVPFTISWSGSSSYRSSSENVVANVALTKPNGGNATGNLTKVYQWRYDNYQSTKEEYRFTVNSSGVYCDSAVSGQCRINATGNITIYAPSGGWRIGWNYIQGEWTKDTDSSVTVQDWSGVSFEGKAAYNGYFSNQESSGNWKYYFAPNENITIRLYVKNQSDSLVSASISSVQYSATQNCWTESCRTYTTPSYTTTELSTGTYQINISNTANWTRGDYAIKAVVGGATITGGNVRVKEFTSPNITSISITNNETYNISLPLTAVTAKSSTCTLYLVNYDNFVSWGYCSGWNSTSSNGTAPTAQTIGACNTTKYNYNGSIYRNEYISNNYHSYNDGSNWSSCSTSGSYQSCSGQDSSRTTTYLSTGGTSHTYTLNLTGLPTQHYGVQVWCYDDDYNYANIISTFKINNSL
ncbi:hypothetical protein J4423_04110 [Candidatus Pacearchaeota archaeon]|nr:hypothetical protein [Candidatus Pacearchaeota archaeon]